MLQYFSTKIRLAKEAGFSNVYQQLLAVWNSLDVEIREHIPERSEQVEFERGFLALGRDEPSPRIDLISENEPRRAHVSPSQVRERAILSTLGSARLQA